MWRLWATFAEQRGPYKYGDIESCSLIPITSLLPSPITATSSCTMTLGGAVTRLPPEILDDIFSLIHQDRARWLVRKSLKRSWVALSHVCQDWRLAALGHARFWIDVDFSMHCEWIKLMLERSRDLPISVRLQGASRSKARFDLVAAQLGLAEIHRARRLRIDDSYFRKRDITRVHQIFYIASF